MKNVRCIFVECGVMERDRMFLGEWLSTFRNHTNHAASH